MLARRTRGMDKRLFLNRAAEGSKAATGRTASKGKPSSTPFRPYGCVRR